MNLYKSQIREPKRATRQMNKSYFDLNLKNAKNLSIPQFPNFYLYK